MADSPPPQDSRIGIATKEDSVTRSVRLRPPFVVVMTQATVPPTADLLRSKVELLAA